MNCVIAAHPGERVEPCGTREILVGANVLPDIPAKVRDLMQGIGGRRPRLLFVVDRTPIMRRGVPAKDYVAALLARESDVEVLVLDDGYPELHASEDVIAQASAAARGVDVIVAMGGGTISDIGKMASVGAGNVPVITVQTAASVDGFTDDVSVILRNGVKRTVPSRWPDIVVADTVLIAEAPARMNRAGFGEINSMFVAPADWLLARDLGFDDGFSWGPVALLHAVGEGIEDWSPGLAEADPESTSALVRALDIRGVATGVAGSTALLSGVEHLVSHMLDMANASAHRSIGLHGAQVGVASVVASLVWDELVARLDALHGEAFVPPVIDREAERAAVLHAFAGLGGSDALAEECWPDYAAKLDRWDAQRTAVAAFVREWPGRRAEFQALVKPARTIARALQAAGVASTFTALEPTTAPELAAWALRNCHMMRNRLTAVDVLHHLGGWDDALVARILHDADALARTMEELV